MSAPEPAAAREADTTLVRLVAVLLIANSHLEAFYSERWMAGDGLLGNTLFYMVSGCGLAVGDAHRHHKFLHWYARRLLRIYPSVVLFELGARVLVGRAFLVWGPEQYISQLLWPTEYGFIAFIVLFYLVFFWVMRPGKPRVYAYAIAAVSIPLVALFVHDAHGIGPGERLSLSSRHTFVYVLFDFALMLLGGYVGTQAHRLRGHLGRDGAIVGVLFGTYMALKYLMVVRAQGSQWYALLFVLAAAIAWFTLRLSQAPGLLTFANGPLLSARIARWIGAMTLEVYIVHMWAPRITPMASVWFPMNLLLFWATTFLLAHGLAVAANWVRTRVATPGGTLRH